MNNLKRVLSLALSGIMLVGMMAVGASAADFSDADKIEHDDAVNVLVALKVINGKDDGSFDPDGDVTRAEMAKMIAVAMNGGNDANTGVKTTASFTDIKGHWAESYIEYCYDMGIISGRGDGTFDPNGNVTGLEATKMVLTALGYDATAYMLTGASWAVRTDELARKADPNLYDELATVAMANRASRDTAAQLIWNGLQNTTRRVTPSTNTSTGEVTWSYGTGARMLKERYDADILVGNFSGNHDMNGDAEKGEIVVSVPTYDKDGELTGDTDDYYVPSDFDISHIGEEVKVIYKEGKNSKRTGPDRNDTVYGVFVTGNSDVVNATRADVKNNKAAETKIKVGGSTYSLASTVTVVTNYVVSEDPTTMTGDELKGDKDNNSALTKLLRGNDKAASGDAIKLLIKDNKVETIYIVESKAAVVTSINSTRITLNNGIGTLDIEDHDIADGLKKDDVVVVTALYDETPADGYVTVKKAETVSGEVTGFKGQENVKLDGTTYNIKDEAALLKSGLTDGVASFAGDDIGEDFTLYLVNGFVVAAVQTSESASNYSVVLEASGTGDKPGSTFKGLQLQVMDAEGVKSIITVADDEDGKNATGATFPVGTIITYTTNKDKEAVVKIMGKGNDTSAATKYSKSTKSFKEVVTSGDCVLFAATEADTKGIKAYNIRNLGNFDAAADKYNYVEKDGKIVAVFVDYGTTVPGATDSTVYGIITADEGTGKKDGTTYNLYKAGVNGQTYDLYTSATLKKGDIVKFEPTTDDIYGTDKIVKITAAEANKIVIGYVDDYNEKDAIITVFTALKGLNADGEETTEADEIKSYKGDEDTRKTYAVDSDIEIYFVDQDADKGVESGSVASFNTTEDQPNIILILTADGTEYVVSTMIVETSLKKPIINK